MTSLPAPAGREGGGWLKDETARDYSLGSKTLGASQAVWARDWAYGGSFPQIHRVPLHILIQDSEHGLYLIWSYHREGSHPAHRANYSSHQLLIERHA